MDPISHTLGAVGLFSSLINTCLTLCKAYKLTRSFGSDFMRMQKLLEIQAARLEALSAREIQFLAETIDIRTAERGTSKIVVSQLAIMKENFEKCHDLMKLYDASMRQANSNAPSNPAEHPLVDLDQKEALRTKIAKLMRGKSLKIFWRRRQRKEKAKRIRAGSLWDKVQLPAPIVAAVDEITLHQETRAEILQRSTGFFRRACWASGNIVSWLPEDKQKFSDAIEELRKCNTELESILRPRPLQTPSDILEKLPESTPVETAMIQTTMKKIHEALSKTNSSPEDGDSLSYSVQLATEYSYTTRRELSGHDHYLRLRDPSCTVFLHAHRTEQQSKRSRSDLILAEVPVDRSSSIYLTDDCPRISCMLQALNLQKYSDHQKPTEDYSLLGATAPQGGGIRLFRDTRTNWESRTTLTDVIRNARYHSTSAVHLVQLAILVVTSHLYFAKVAPSFADLRTENYHFYSGDDAESDLWDDENLFILRPYLSASFGSRPVKKSPRFIGNTSGIGSSPGSIMHLGLLLFQVGSGRLVDYGTGRDGLFKAKRAAITAAHDIDVLVGGRFAEIVQSCLDWKYTPLSDLVAEETRMGQSVLSSLQKLGEQLEESHFYSSY